MVLIIYYKATNCCDIRKEMAIIIQMAGLFIAMFLLLQPGDAYICQGNGEPSFHQVIILQSQQTIGALYYAAQNNERQYQCH